MSKFRYTSDQGTFTPEQRAFYEENGYIMFRKLIPDHVIDTCHQHFIDICNGKVETGPMTVMKDKVLAERGAKGEKLINKIQDWLYDDVFYKEYTCHPEIVKVVTSIIGPNVTAAHSMLINKPPDTVKDLSLHPTHQDLHYFPFRPVDKICASWTAMEKINEANGCLYAIPGSHKMGIAYPHGYSDFKNKLYHGVQGFDHLPRVHLIMEKGDTVFFHPLLLHGSGPNTTTGFRKAISVHYADSNSEFIDVRGTTQENIAKEIEALALKKSGGYKVTFVDVWKLKSRIVVGEPGNFQRIDSQL